MSSRLTLVRSAIGLRPNFELACAGVRYQGRRYREDVRNAGASATPEPSILPTRNGLLNALCDVGFTSVHEILNPVVPLADDLLDSIFLAAMCGEEVGYRSVPALSPVASLPRRRLRRARLWLSAGAHPQQGILWRIREMVFKTYFRTVFSSSRPIEEWRDSGSSSR